MEIALSPFRLRSHKALFDLSPNQPTRLQKNIFGNLTVPKSRNDRITLTEFTDFEE